MSRRLTAEAIGSFFLFAGVLGSGVMAENLMDGNVAVALPGSVPASVALYITAAYWFTSSTSFANPAIIVVRSLSDTFAGIAPVDVPAFIAAQLVGMMLAVGVGGWLSADPPTGKPVSR